jgi:hypothetical protein
MVTKQVRTREANRRKPNDSRILARLGMKVASSTYWFAKADVDVRRILQYVHDSGKLHQASNVEDSAGREQGK